MRRIQARRTTTLRLASLVERQVRAIDKARPAPIFPEGDDSRALGAASRLSGVADTILIASKERTERQIADGHAPLRGPARHLLGRARFVLPDELPELCQDFLTTFYGMYARVLDFSRSATADDTVRGGLATVLRLGRRPDWQRTPNDFFFHRYRIQTVNPGSTSRRWMPSSVAGGSSGRSPPGSTASTRATWARRSPGAGRGRRRRRPHGRPSVVDELAPVSRITGLAQFEHRAARHGLSEKALAKRPADQLLADYEAPDLIVAHIGGGVTVAAATERAAVSTSTTASTRDR